MEMMRKFWSEYGDGITDFFGGVLKAIIVAAIAQALGPIVIGGVLKMAIGGLGGLIRGLMPGGAGGGADPSQSMTLGEKIHEFAIGFAEAVKEIANIGIDNAAKAGGVLLVLAGSFALGVLGMAGLAKALSAMEVDPMMMGIAAGVMVAIAYAAKAAGELVEVMATVPDDKKAWAKAALMMGAVTLVFGAVMAFTVMAVQSLAGVTFDESIGKVLMAAGALALTGLTVTAGIVAMGTILAVIAALASGPQVLLLLAAIAAASAIFVGIMSFVTNTVSDLAAYKPEQAEAAMNMAQAAGILIDTVLKVLDAVWGIMKGVVWDADTFSEVLAKLGDVVTSIETEFMPAALAAADLVTGNPNEIKQKLSIVTDAILAFAPLMNMFTAAMSIKDLRPRQVGLLIEKMSGGLTGIIDKMQIFITGIARSLGTMSKEKIDKVAAAAPLLEGLANILGALQQPSELFQDQMKSFSSSTNRLVGADETVDRMEKQLGADRRVQMALGMMTDLLTNIQGPLTRLVTSLSQIEIPGDPKTIKKNMETIAAVMSAVGETMSALNSAQVTLEKFQDKGGNTTSAMAAISQLMLDLKYNITRRGGLLDSMASITSAAANKLGSLGKDGIPALDASVEIMRKITGMMSATIPIQALVGDFKASVNAISELDGVFTEQAIEPLVQIVDAVTAFDERIGTSLSDMPDINALVGKVGDKLKVTGADTITIQRENLNLSVNFSVHLDAKALVETLVEGEFLAEEVQGSKMLENTNAVNRYQ